MSATASWRALGTSATVVVADAAALADARAAVERELAAIDVACSRFRDDSELTALNAAGGAPFLASPLLAQAIGVALRAARTTRGAVDPTLGAQLVRAGYDRDFAELAARNAEPTADRDEPVAHGPVSPAAADADAARACPAASVSSPGRASSAPRATGPASSPAWASSAPRATGPASSSAWSAVQLDRHTRTVTIPAGVALDLGATAKALAADRAARAAHAAAGCGVLVSLGGDISVAGPAPADGWAIRVTDDHAGPQDALGQTVTIRSGGLATSGTTVRRWQAGGEPRHHILDPRTGEPAAVVWRTASVAAATCVDANTASTAAIVRGTDAAPWLLRHGLPARLVAASGRVLLLGAWPRRDAAPVAPSRGGSGGPARRDPAHLPGPATGVA